MEHQTKKCVFAGTFDPPTLGHKEILKNCLQLFDEVVVAILTNPQKKPYFTEAERIEMLQLMFSDQPRLRIRTFSGTATALLEEENTRFYVRGIRNGIDLDYENANFYASKKLNENFTAVYLPCSQELLHVSSSVVKNSLQFNTPIDEYVTPAVKEYIYTKVNKN